MDKAVERIRQMIGQGDFSGATALWEQWSGYLAVKIQAGTATPEERAHTVELYRWSREALLCARAQVLDRLNTLHAAGAYVRGRW